MLHLSFPARPPRDAETRAVDRDIRDAEHLACLEALVLCTLDRTLPLIYPLEHPAAEYHPYSLATDLQEHLIDIRAEQARLRGPLVIAEP